ncbi:LysR substrate-binding domain-containing protein [Pseudomonas brassicacearum]|uniref:LysR substrate-binding domain-containing protein n=1 Tax=Pseudomonas brassicacearum TaxID=930166 RepID=UPI00057937D6|nr:LysR substrate-binding domain-containing protein [Pseudomonas brassicacearum]ALQ04711.1 Glycine cleavage system transcriptional activator [Pseudomonas brassicacearum]AOS42129.1 LysR family transcriptional regulator [Pseudomonas brassicacearum]KIR14912.1 Glycine cleavage system transcriptional activator [Pseudomonas fluorescens]WLG66367.1 LysR substrate-binding domain-containing protein [Pseudomonas brassicacearum]
MFAKLPLTALRGFESAARLGSFKAAAQELNVSPAAISHQVKSLEAFLGVRLFERSSQSVRLSADGERLQPFMHRALLDIQHGLQVLSPPCAAQSLVVSTTPAFASLWLIPRLGDFHRLHPEIDVRLHTSNDVVDLQRDASIDLAIRALFTPDPQLFEQPLLDEYFGVYCRPGWQPPAAGSPVELIDVPWLSSAKVAIDWPAWCAKAGTLGWLENPRFRHYDEEQHALQAAIAGHGLVLASNVLVTEAVARGELVEYRPEVRLAGARYTVVCVPGRERQMEVRAFSEWLLEPDK